VVAGLLQEKSHYKTIGKSRDTGLYHGMLYRRLPSATGRSRWVLESTTPQGFDSPLAAAEYMNSCLPGLPPLDVVEMAKAFAVGLPDLPPGAEVELRVFNPQSANPAPQASLPKIRVRVDGQPVDMDLCAAQLLRLIESRTVEFHSDNFDPSLSCGYVYFRSNQC
jgi:hypothetical protein